MDRGEQVFAMLERMRRVTARLVRRCHDGPAVDLWEEADEGKLAELILYVAHQIEDDPTGGATKLNKILYFSEFRYIRTHGRPITGDPYQKLPNGPAPRHLVRVRDRLLAEDAARLTLETYFGRPQHRLVPLRDPDMDLFVSSEVETVNTVVKALWGMSARDASELSHRDKAWQLVEVNEDIPFSTAFLAQKTVVTETSRKHTRALAEKLGILH